MTSPSEQVVLLADDGTAIGSALKSEVHGHNTPLHLAFACYLTDEHGRLLVTRRALSKQTWPGVWTNSFCGHPGPGEDMEQAIVRRAREELGAEIADLRLQVAGFRYRAVDASGIVENEVCPVFSATLVAGVSPAPSEVSEWEWVRPVDLATAIDSAPFVFSPWLREQLPLLLAAGTFAPAVAS